VIPISIMYAFDISWDEVAKYVAASPEATSIGRSGTRCPQQPRTKCSSTTTSAYLTTRGTRSGRGRARIARHGGLTRPHSR
jgi:hypothetical protein